MVLIVDSEYDFEVVEYSRHCGNFAQLNETVVVTRRSGYNLQGIDDFFSIHFIFLDEVSAQMRQVGKFVQVAIEEMLHKTLAIQFDQAELIGRTRQHAAAFTNPANAFVNHIANLATRPKRRQILHTLHKVEKNGAL